VAGALIACHDLELELGRHQAVVDELTDLVDRYPANEALAERVKARKRLSHLCADKAYGSRANRVALRRRGITRILNSPT
jgi:hypothetical protein